MKEHLHEVLQRMGWVLLGWAAIGWWSVAANSSALPASLYSFPVMIAACVLISMRPKAQTEPLQQRSPKCIARLWWTWLEQSIAPPNKASPRKVSWQQKNECSEGLIASLLRLSRETQLHPFFQIADTK